jgi:heterodisulfide reductase subunit C2
MAIHEKSLIRPENLKTHDKLVIDGVDVSGHWSTFIEPRVVTDYNEALQDEIAALPGGEYIHRCWQCGSCTNSCTVNAVNPEFNPRYWIYLIRMGMESELLRDKDIIWQCVSCNKCTYACPRDVVPEGVMKATSHWLELKGHTPKTKSMVFDEVFTEQVVDTGKIEEGRTIRRFFERTGQPLKQDWLVEMVKRVARRLPIKQGIAMALQTVFRPRVKGWKKASAALTEYIHEQEARNRKALSLPDRTNGDLH